MPATAAVALARRAAAALGCLGLFTTLAAAQVPSTTYAKAPPLPDLTGKVVLITGSTDGLGRDVARRVAAAGARVLVTGRSAERGDSLVDEITKSGKGSAAFYRADLASLAEVRRLADRVIRDNKRLDFLINNAGVGLVFDSTRKFSADGYELHFAVNYLAHYLLTQRLLPLITASAPARIINVSSGSQEPINFDDVMMTRGFNGERGYAQSKLMQVMMTIDMAPALEKAGILTYSLHPATTMGTTMARLLNVKPRSTIAEGVESVINAMTTTEPSGTFFNQLKPWKAQAQAYDAEARRKLRILSDSLAGLAAGSAAAGRPSTMAGRSTVYAPNGMVATSQPLASAAGLEVLRTGGNAIDAAVAAAAVLSVTEPHMTGIGGDLFAIVWLAREQKLVALNAAGRAGSLMTRETLVARGFKPGVQQGVLSVTVPGALAGWDLLVRTHGRRTLAAALAPAIRYAQDGFPVTPIIAQQWAAETALLEKDPGAAATFLPGGRAPAAGEWFRNPDYARTLRTIAASGIGAFYGGPIGRRIVARLKELDGLVTLDDLRKNAPTWVTPISVPFRGYRVWELPPSNQGVAALEMLRILEPYDLKAMGHNSAAYLHHLIEAKKLAYADLGRFVGDADHLDLPAEKLLSDEFIAERRSHLDATRAAARVDPGPYRTASETIYLTTADLEGNMVSLINSNFDAFGSGIVVPGTGFPLHNRGAGFTVTEGLPNTVAPGKRPFHTLIPGFVTRTENGRETAYMSFGLMGGGMQAQGHAQFLLNHFVFGMDLQEAIDAPRFRHLDGLRVAIETPVGDAVRATLTGMGHVLVDERPVSFGGAQAIVRLKKGYAAGSDPRKDGMAVGY